MAARDILTELFGSENGDRKQTIMRLGRGKIRMNSYVLTFQNEFCSVEVVIQKVRFYEHTELNEKLQVEYKVYRQPGNVLLLHHKLKNDISPENVLDVVYKLATGGPTTIPEEDWTEMQYVARRLGWDEVDLRGVAFDKVIDCLSSLFPDDIVDMSERMNNQYLEAFEDWSIAYGYIETSWHPSLWKILIRFATHLRTDIPKRTLSLQVQRPRNYLTLYMQVCPVRRTTDLGCVRCLAVWKNEHWLKLRIAGKRGVFSDQLKEFFTRCMLLQEDLFSVGVAGRQWKNWDDFQTVVRRVVAGVDNMDPVRDVQEDGNVEALGRHFGRVRGVEEVMKWVNDVIVIENLVLITKEYDVGCILTLEFKQTSLNHYYLKWTMQLNEDYEQERTMWENIPKSRPMEEWFQMMLIMGKSKINTESDVPRSLVEAISIVSGATGDYY